MNWLRTSGFIAVGLSYAASAGAHRIDEYLQATLLTVESEHVHASIRLIPGDVVAPSVIASIDSDHDGVFSDIEQRAYAQRVVADLSIGVDGAAARPKLVSWEFPAPTQMLEGLGEILIDYTVALPSGTGDRSLVLQNRNQGGQSVYLVNVLAPSDRSIRIVDEQRSADQSRYQLRFSADASALKVEPSSAQATSWSRLRLPRLFELGMHHIAEGANHLMFLLAILLPAPLIASGNRWGRTGGVRRSVLRVLALVTAFTLGHSITLTLAAIGSWALPARAVEVLIAFSVLVSAMNALRPIFSGREAMVAALFGLVHGLAFAATLDRLGLDFWSRLEGTLSFNLGIEVMQLLVISAFMPPLLLMSRTPTYGAVRVAGALIAALAAIEWMAERVLGLDTHVDAITETFGAYAQELAVAFALFALGSFIRHQVMNPQEGVPASEVGTLGHS